MGRYETCLNFVLTWEGGKSDHPEDKGGRTAYGVTQATYDRHRHSKNLPKRDVWEIERQEVESIYLAYWTSCHAGAFEMPLAGVMFDTAVNFGIGRAKQYFRETTGLTIKPENFDKIRMLTESQEFEIAKKIIDKRIEHRYRRVKQDPSQIKFIRGWLRRDQALGRFIAEHR